MPAPAKAGAGAKNIAVCIASLAGRMATGMSALWREPSLPPLDSIDLLGLDPVSAAVERGIEAGRELRHPSSSHFARAQELFRDACNSIDLQQTIADLLSLVEDFPAEPYFQTSAIYLMELAGEPEIGRMWQLLDERFPNMGVEQIRELRRTVRHSGIDGGRARMQTYLAFGRSDPSGLMRLAVAAEELRDFAAADQAILELLASSEPSERHLHDAARLYHRRGHVIRAQEIAEEALARFPDSARLQKQLYHIKRQVQRVIAVFPEIADSDQHLATALFLRLIKEFSAGRANVRQLPSSFLGPVVMVGATLGSGGAERQLVNTALSLQQAVTSGAEIGGIYINGPVRVICRSVSGSPSERFLLPEVEAAGIPVGQYTTFPEFGGDQKHSCLGSYRHLLSHLPNDIADATRRLADALREMSPDVVHIWQDGAIVSTYLAALAAGVPRIVLGLRTLPPSDRLNRHRPEYEALYKSAARTPGVCFTTNTPVIAKRYAQWLDIDPGIFRIVPNGLQLHRYVEPAALSPEADAFLNRPRERGFTVGGIMRFDANKRPLLWAEMALAMLDIAPDARFIMIGDGPLCQAAKDFVALSRHSDSFLFVDPTLDVAFWLSRFDVVVSLSHQEGLPNNLIEAQIAGVPVVATPAGGSGETFEHGFTGTLLPSNVDIDPAEVARAVCQWRLSPEDRRSVAQLASRRAREKFSLDAMLDATIAAYFD
jgi:glycosyltransferase involved in cell wall biosynthesis